MKNLFFGDSITDMSRNRNENAEEIYTYGSGYPMLVASALYRKNPLRGNIHSSNLNSFNKFIDMPRL